MQVNSLPAVHAPFIHGCGSIQVQPRDCLIPPLHVEQTCKTIGSLQHGTPSPSLTR
jgi:hypothetical protein